MNSKDCSFAIQKQTCGHTLTDTHTGHTHARTLSHTHGLNLSGRTVNIKFPDICLCRHFQRKKHNEKPVICGQAKIATFNLANATTCTNTNSTTARFPLCANTFRRLSAANEQHLSKYRRRLLQSLARLQSADDSGRRCNALKE